MQSKATQVFLLFSVLLLALFGPAAAAPPEKISIPTASISNSPKSLVAYRYLPASAPPHPAVVMLHGCGGAYDKRGEIGARQRMWGEYLASHGFVALLVDSFTPRDTTQICTIKFGERTLKETDRAGDAYAALAWLRQQPGVDAQRISVMGWSHGAGVALQVISNAQQADALKGGFHAAVSFYPGCTSRNKKADQFHPYAPLLVLMGESDDWTPAAPCQALTDTLAQRGEPMRIVLYPDTYHDFDNPSLSSKRVRMEVPNGVRPGEGVTVAPNAEARKDAMQRVLAFLKSPQ
ncbi:MAG: dienelactone hydrolase family protein [Candidatus Saccharibacteria bacterium]|nr:dienelactone hydrolase family protein [Rhodoferax sp.]